MRSRSVLSTVGAGLLCTLVLGACSSSDASESDKPKATTTTTTKAATVLLTGGDADRVERRSPTPRSTKRRSRPCSTRASSTSTPRCSRRCIDGAVGHGLRRAVRPGVAANATGVDRAALTDEGITPVTTSPTVTATPVRFDGLADANGAILLVATTFNVDVAGTTDTGPLTIHRTNELTFAPGPERRLADHRLPRRRHARGRNRDHLDHRGGAVVIRRLAVGIVVLTTARRRGRSAV